MSTEVRALPSASTIASVHPPPGLNNTWSRGWAAGTLADLTEPPGTCGREPGIAAGAAGAWLVAVARESATTTRAARRLGIRLLRGNPAGVRIGPRGPRLSGKPIKRGTCQRRDTSGNVI